jgi:hypothetical protein
MDREPDGGETIIANGQRAKLSLVDRLAGMPETIEPGHSAELAR